MTAPGTPSDLPRLPARQADAHKGDFGRALLVGGSRGMSGAITLSGLACLRSGAGLVQLAVPAECQPIVAAAEPSFMTAALDDDPCGRIDFRAKPRLTRLIEPATAVACGPGLARSRGLTKLVCWLYSEVRRPMVFDADALNALARQPDVLEKPAGPRVLTPHPGEFRRLLGKDESLSRSEMESQAKELAARWQAVIILKGQHSFITDGQQSSVNTTGNPGMATGGTGDVLTGIVAALLAQGLLPLNAARLAAHVHGLAGDLVSAELGQVSLVASDLIDYLPAAWKQTT